MTRTQTLTITPAQLRSLALLEPLREAQAYVQFHPDSSLVPTPTLEQQALEGRILKELRYLLRIDQPEYPSEGRMVPLEIEAGRNYLTLVVGQRQLANELCELLPAWNFDEGLALGIPFLRARENAGRTGVTLFRLGVDAEVTFVGVSMSALEAERETFLRCGDLVGVRPGDPVLGREFDVQLRDNAEFIALSAVVRRLGLFLSANPFVIETWTTPGILHVELAVPSNEPTPLARLLEHLQSPHFAPRFELTREFDHHHLFSIEGSTVKVNVRTLPRLAQPERTTPPKAPYHRDSSNRPHPKSLGREAWSP
ncbi:hypothetical protein [Microbacterium imperiale]|uniref:hypothetical protein n=1 Tax=Microbacterium imperiale TaxID=33884 RepID=UPI001AEAB958|nr:hypothetical protein [Microbacterium imperiale]MBP2420722.1 hypothetical protein [Microbacterium imperiale]MDS0200627.1 hypothetical protein [Microbacterium imperiale]BFE41062.1 hypothetical protein GCM10017544_20180 [Microbacterium imperiale]